MSITKSQVDLVQGDTESVGVKNGGRPFGYVAGDEGGFFFTWMPTLAETIASIEEDEIDGDGDLDETEVAVFLTEYLPTTRKGRELWGSDDE